MVRIGNVVILDVWVLPLIIMDDEDSQGHFYDALPLISYEIENM